MKQNKYDDEHFFKEYGKMARSIYGLDAAGEWHQFQQLFPKLAGKDVLDLGCGYGWHCRYARENLAKSVIGVDLSEKMIVQAKEMTDDDAITYEQKAIEDIDFAHEQFDVVISSLAFHYVSSFEEVCKKIYTYLKPGGQLVFSVEHPIFTAEGKQDWHYDDAGNIIHWPVDHYHVEGERTTTFLQSDVMKYHRTMSTYINNLIDAGFTVTKMEESIPSEKMLREIPESKHEFRRPMFLMISAVKN